MTPETLAALNGSILKWQRIVDGTGTDEGRANCPLCQLFYEPWNIYELCAGCPVVEKVGESQCRKTPYEKWERIKRDPTATELEKKNAAQAELDFLKSLLPPAEIPAPEPAPKTPFTENIESVIQERDQLKRDYAALRSVVELSLELAPDFLDNEHGHFSKICRDALANNSGKGYIHRDELEPTVRFLKTAYASYAYRNHCDIDGDECGRQLDRLLSLMGNEP